MTPLQKDNAPPHRSDALRLRVELFDRLMATRGVLTVVEQARAVGVHRATLFRLRAGDGGTNAKVAMRMADACGTTVEQLFERVEGA